MNRDIKDQGASSTLMSQSLSPSLMDEINNEDVQEVLHLGGGSDG